MRKIFDNSEDYLEYLKGKYQKKYKNEKVVDDEFHRITIQQMEKIGQRLPIGSENGLESVISNSFKTIVQSLPATRRALVDGHIAAGVLEHGQANAFIARSPNGKLAILFSSGLAMFLHKYIKLVCASVDPRQIVYCNRKDYKEITRDDTGQYIGEMIEHFKIYSIPRGPFVKLSEKETLRASGILNFAETFILCHELGHFFNGDLDGGSHFTALPAGISGEKFDENKDHEMEYRADSVGYGIYLETINKISPGISPQAALSPVMLMFDLFYQLAGGESSTHPHPHDRVVRIVHNYFSPEMAVRAAEGLRDPRLLPDVFPTPDSETEGAI
ncbi:hypothetical protein NKI38_04250 [Mesorhizobium sp. M0621]|uniref:hypothetical protein n=1 Tax=Mesorhizobium sp. M0621 TaxID=2956974 RepID=UPI00333A4118